MAPKQSYVAGSSSSSRASVNPIVTKFVKRNAKSRVTYDVKPESNENLKFSKLRKEEKHTFHERLSKLQVRKIAQPRLVDWDVFTDYECEDELRKIMRMSYVYEGDGDTFEDHSWERAFSIYENIYREWCLEFFSTFYFERKVVDVVRDTCIWFRLCGNEHAYTLPEFAVALGLYEQDEVKHRLFEPHFVSLVRYHNDYEGIPEYWNRVGDPNCSRRNSSKLRNPLMKILHKLITWGVLHRTGSRDKCNQPDLWLMKIRLLSRKIIAEYLSRRAPGIVKPTERETWDAIGFGKALDRRRKTLEAWMESAMAAPQPPYQPPPPIRNVHAQSGFDSGWGDWNRELNDIERREVCRDSMMMRNNYNFDYSMPMLQHMAREANYKVPPYNPPNVPPYPFQYDPYPRPYPYPYPGYAPFPEPVPVYGRIPNVGGSSYDVGGSSSGVGKKRQKLFIVFDEDENYEEVNEEDGEESEDERIHTPEDMDDE